MTKYSNGFPLPVDCASPEFQELASDALDICVRYEITSETLRIDLEFETYNAVASLIEGRSLADASALLSDAHPFAHKVRAELANIAQRLADGATAILA